VRIDSVTVASEDGGPVAPGCAAVICVLCHSAEAAGPVLCSLEIGGGGVFPLATTLGGFEGAGFLLTPGPNEFVCRIDPLPLAAGTYQVCASVVLRDSAVVLGLKGYHDESVLFEVHSPQDPASSMTAYRKNIVHLPAQWQPRPEADSRAEDAKGKQP
jgi:hypothetical protein